MGVKRAITLLIVFAFFLDGCGSSSVGAKPSPTQADSSSAQSSPSPSSTPSLGALERGDVFATASRPYIAARYSRTLDASLKSAIRIAIVSVEGRPAFSPSIIEVAPGQELLVTVFQSGDRSSAYKHNFSIQDQGINEDLPIGEGHEVTVTVVAPETGTLTFFCKYHGASEQHAGEFQVR